jgi:hypothetical protein
LRWGEDEGEGRERKREKGETREEGKKWNRAKKNVFCNTLLVFVLGFSFSLSFPLSPLRFSSPSPFPLPTSNCALYKRYMGGDISIRSEKGTGTTAVVILDKLGNVGN